MAFEVIARTLARRVLLRTREEVCYHALRYLECDPDIEGIAQAQDRVLTIEPVGYRYLITENDAVLKEVIGLSALVDQLHRMLFLQSVDDRPDAAVLHAAMLREHGRRVVLVGRVSAGKTSLALALVQAGFEFEGDEHVFVEADGVVARPRAFRVKTASLSLFPEAKAKMLSAAPYFDDDHGYRIFNVDPKLVAGAWRIVKGRADALIAIRPNHGGYSSLRPVPPLALAQTLMAEFGSPRENKRGSIGAIAALVSTARTYDLSLGDHPTAIKCNRRSLVV